MKSIREIYKIGKGPSSSHTMGPERAALRFKGAHPNADAYRVTLYGSLSKTGRGHGTDRVLIETLAPAPAEIVFCNDESIALPHPNTMDFVAFKGGQSIGEMRVMSIGGGDIAIEGEPGAAPKEVYAERTFEEIAEVCRARTMRISDYGEMNEGEGIWDFLQQVWNAMSASIHEGLTCRGELPGGLHVERKAQYLINQRHIDERPETRENRIVCAYAFAVSEQNASQGTVVTAPTCGSCATLPAVLKYMQEEKGIPDRQILKALAVAGVIGNIVKTNASISGAECGCQAEIGTACSMASAALAELFEMGIDQIEYAAEVALEHHLGLTCDPIDGLVQIPCIERNAVAAMRAINAVRIANFLTSTRKISFDMVVETMYQTGKDLNRIYRETAEGGLAKLYH
ncbi:MAG: L-serine ammonia-lyase, iron-sulfur-dependent, subunit alpha [Clostridia bacterium]|nr:L-serine ammonia-lyase, iron-sulfur-dependent, subunit alpha [Clostridia bacterium]